MAMAAQTAAGVGVSNTKVSGSNQLVGVRAHLQKNLDAKKMKPGDAILARPEVKMHVPDGLDLDTGSMLVGHVDKVQPSVDGNDSAIGVTFDKLRLKDAREVAIKATILWIGKPPDYLNPTIHSAAADRTTPGVGVEAGFSGTPPLQGYQGSEIAGAPSREKQGAGNQKTGLPGEISMQMDAIAGVNFFSDMGRADSGWFRSKRANVSVPAGTVLAFAIVALPDAGTHP
ncbi:MAG TPA: hypothetical protein VIX42_11775 [Edaphobacter sp.]